MWNERYASTEFAYGTEPNSFLVQNASLLTSPVLSLAEGEGRNAVFLASLGLDVLGVDASDVGLAKAQTLAASRGLAIRTEVADLASYEPPENHHGSVISISAHFPSKVRNRLYPQLERSLKPGGIILLEAYTKAQISRNTGGPRDSDMLALYKIHERWERRLLRMGSLSLARNRTICNSRPPNLKPYSPSRARSTSAAVSNQTTAYM